MHPQLRISTSQAVLPEACASRPWLQLCAVVRRTRVYTNFGPRPQRGGQPAAPANPWAQLLHFLPILLLVAFTFFSTQSEPVRPLGSALHMPAVGRVANSQDLWCVAYSKLPWVVTTGGPSVSYLADQ
jgi:hypothetical protein